MINTKQRTFVNLLTPRKVTAILLTLTLTMSLTSCDLLDTVKAKITGENPQKISADSESPNTPTPTDSLEDSLEFGLSKPDDTALPQATQAIKPIPDNPDPLVPSAEDKIYGSDGDVAYELNPQTLERVGPPLDPVTHAPISNNASKETSALQEASDLPVVSIPHVEHEAPLEPMPTRPTVPDISESNGTSDVEKIPNTGIFPEDD